MAQRCLLHRTKLKQFEEWLVEHEWKIEETKGFYEVLRARKSGRLKPLIIYMRLDTTEHYTVTDDGVQVVRNFIKETRRTK